MASVVWSAGAYAMRERVLWRSGLYPMAEWADDGVADDGVDT